MLQRRPTVWMVVPMRVASMEFVEIRRELRAPEASRVETRVSSSSAFVKAMPRLWRSHRRRA